MVFGNGVKNIQAAAYNGARTVYVFISITVSWLGKSLEQDTKHPKLRKSPFRPKEAFEPRI